MKKAEGNIKKVFQEYFYKNEKEDENKKTCSNLNDDVISNIKELKERLVQKLMMIEEKDL